MITKIIGTKAFNESGILNHLPMDLTKPAPDNRQPANEIHSVHQIHDGFFTTFTKRKISLHAPEVTSIHLDDIAHGLSNVCRFGGHTGEFYSVAQHSILVWSLCGKLYNHETIQLKKLALLHDAAEAYLGDVIKPLKVILGNIYGDIEYNFMQAICFKFGIEYGDLEKIKLMDRTALEIEHEYFFHDKREVFDRYFNTHENTCWSPTEAKAMYLWAFKETFEG